MGRRPSAWLRAMSPQRLSAGWRGNLRAVAGALLGILATGGLTLLLWPASPLAMAGLIAPMGASAVLLFATPASPLAQPWPVIGGNLVSSAVAITCAHWIAAPLPAAAVAVSAAIASMLALRCLHPPGGAAALMIVLGPPQLHAAGYGLLWFPVATNTILLLGLAALFHYLTGHSYPRQAARAVLPGSGVERADLQAALHASDEIFDISIDDLERLLRRAEAIAKARRVSGKTGVNLPKIASPARESYLRDAP